MQTSNTSEQLADMQKRAGTTKGPDISQKTADRLTESMMDTVAPRRE